MNVHGDIHLGGTNTTTNQNRKIYWTGFDKEATNDFTDYAEIRHTTNVHGITGSVLELKAENDATDGIALNASSGIGQIALNGKIRGNIEMHDYGGRIRPSYGTGDKGIFCSSNNRKNNYFSVDSFARSVVDAVGSGDALLAYSAIALKLSKSLVQAGIIGSIAAARACEYDGNQPIGTREVIEIINDIEKKINYPNK